MTDTATTPPRAQLPLLTFDDQSCFARDDEEVLLVGLPVVDGHRLARHEHEGVDAELVGIAAPAFEVVGDDADRAAAVGVTPLGVAHVEDVPALARRGEPVLGLLQFRLGNRWTGYQLGMYRSRSAATVGPGRAPASKRSSSVTEEKVERSTRRSRYRAHASATRELPAG
jgi:hypothetical protein